MTPLETVNEFLKSPLGVYVGIIFAAIATYVAALLKQRGDTKSRQRLQAERDDEANKNIAAIRTIAVDALNRTKQLEQDKDSLEAAARAATASAEAARVSEQAAKAAELSAKSRIDSLQINLDATQNTLKATQGDLSSTQAELKTTQEQLITREAESKKNAEDIGILRNQFKSMEDERNAALKLVETRNVELKERDDKIAKLERDLADTRAELGQVKERVIELEKKKTGPLPELLEPTQNPNGVPPTLAE